MELPIHRFNASTLKVTETSVTFIDKYSGPMLSLTNNIAVGDYCGIVRVNNSTTIMRIDTPHNFTWLNIPKVLSKINRRLKSSGIRIESIVIVQSYCPITRYCEYYLGNKLAAQTFKPFSKETVSC